jgi:hypothetical protein
VEVVLLLEQTPMDKMDFLGLAQAERVAQVVGVVVTEAIPAILALFQVEEEAEHLASTGLPLLLAEMERAEE